MSEGQQSRGGLMATAFLVAAACGVALSFFGNGWALIGAAAGAVVGALLGRRQQVLALEKENTSATFRLPRAIAAMLKDSEVRRGEVRGNFGGQVVLVRTTEAGDKWHADCSVQAARGEEYLTDVTTRDLGGIEFVGPGQLTVSQSHVRCRQTGDALPDEADAWIWVKSIIVEADTRRISAGGRLKRLVELVEAGRSSALDVLATIQDRVGLVELAERLVVLDDPAARLIGARWLGADALEALVDDLAYEPVWQAKALQARAELDELSPDAIRRWAGVPGLHLELLIDQMRRGPTHAVDGLADAAPLLREPHRGRLKVLADAIIERGSEAESATRGLFDAQPVARQDLARALGAIGGVPSLVTLRAANGAQDWPDFDDEYDAIEQAIAQITRRLGGSGTGMLTLGDRNGPVGSPAVAGQTEHE